jgi:type II secretory pathway component PulF
MLTLFSALNRYDTPRYRAELFRAWGTGVSAGLPHQTALEALGRSKDGRTEEGRRHLIVGTQQGKSIAALMKARPTLFDGFESAMLVAGEETGTLAAALARLADLYGRDYKKMLRIRVLLGYPIFFWVIGAFVAPLPLLKTRGWQGYLTGVGLGLVALFLIGGVFLSLIGGVLAAGSTASIERFARALASLSEAGIPIGRVVRLAVDVSQNAELARHIAKRTERELNTTPMATLFAGCRAVPPGLMSQMAVADASGDYAGTLRRYADRLDAEER